MQLCITQYSLTKLYEQGATSDELFAFCREIGLEYVDILDYERYWGGDFDGEIARIPALLEEHGLKLAAFATNTAFTKDAPAEREKNVKIALRALDHCEQLGASKMRIFGGYAAATDDLDVKCDHVVSSIKQFIGVAESKGITLVIENHGGMPGTAEEVIRVIEEVGSENLRALVDIGNFLVAGQDTLEGTRKLAHLCEHVHAKDFKLLPEPPREGSRARSAMKPTVIGEGDVKVVECLKALKDGGYDGFISIEFEAFDMDSREGIRRSVKYIENVMP